MRRYDSNGRSLARTLELGLFKDMRATVEPRVPNPQTGAHLRRGDTRCARAALRGGHRVPCDPALRRPGQPDHSRASSRSTNLGGVVRLDLWHHAITPSRMRGSATTAGHTQCDDESTWEARIRADAVIHSPRQNHEESRDGTSKAQTGHEGNAYPNRQLTATFQPNNKNSIKKRFSNL
jgi:hypothetical protein